MLMSVSSSKENTDSPWHKLLEISKISALDTPNQPHRRNKEPDDSVYIFEHSFGKLTNTAMLVGSS